MQMAFANTLSLPPIWSILIRFTATDNDFYDKYISIVNNIVNYIR